MVEIPFGGLAQVKSIDEILYGYEDDLLKQLATMDPAMVSIDFKSIGW